MRKSCRRYPEAEHALAKVFFVEQAGSRFQRIVQKQDAGGPVSVVNSLPSFGTLWRVAIPAVIFMQSRM